MGPLQVNLVLQPWPIKGTRVLLPSANRIARTYQIMVMVAQVPALMLPEIVSSTSTAVYSINLYFNHRCMSAYSVLI